MGRIQEMTQFSKREALFCEIQEINRRGLDTSLLQKELRKLDHQLDLVEEPVAPSPTDEELLIKKMDALFERCVKLAKMKPFSFSYLIKGHPRAELARLIPQLCRLGEQLENHRKKEVIIELKLESEKAWNRQLYSTGFLKIHDRWSGN
jgi:hypothetical protein